MLTFTFFPENSPNFSLARAFNGTMYRHFPPLAMWWCIAISATRVFPLAVGIATRRFFPSKMPARTHSSWGG